LNAQETLSEADWLDARILPPSQEEDLKVQTKKQTPVVSAVFTFNDGKESQNVIVKHDLPTSDYPVEKAFAFLAAEAAEKVKHKSSGRIHHD
jgi:hypothetical protein